MMKCKKLIFILSELIVICLFISTNVCFANDVIETKKIVKFIYLNGSNANSENAREYYTKGTCRLQKEIKTVFENDKFISKYMLEDGNYKIDDTPEVLFWGFQSQKSLNAVNNDFAIASLVSPKIAQSVRRVLSHCLHDAIWVQKERNMQRVIKQLHRMVLESDKNGDKVVLLGHSAGSFVTYNYLLHKLKAIDIGTFFSTKDSNNYRTCTCIDAIVDSKLGYQLINGKILLNPNEKQFTQAYSKLDYYSQKSCMPDNSVIGIINFGSPLSLFYPDVVGGDSLMSQDQIFAFFKRMQEDNIFLLTVNFADDPVGFPVGKNITAQDIEMAFAKVLNKNARGFIYNYSSVKSPSTFISAHSSYWKHPKKFAKMCSEAYKKGLQYFYGIL